MTNEQRTRCHAIIHSAAIAAGGGNALPVPGLGVAADTAALAGMAIGLAGVFGKSLPESVAKTMAVNALKQAVLRQPVKVIAKELSKLLPVFGSVFAASVSVGIVEAAGWSLAFIVSGIPLLGCILLPIAQLAAVGVVAYVFIRERRRPSCRQMWCGRSPRSSATASGPAYKKQ